MKLISNTKLEDKKIQLEIQVEKAEFTAAVDKSIAENSKNITIPGFRKGKAPKAMIIKMYGVESFYEDAINACYPDAYLKTIDELGLEPVERANIEIDDVNEEGFIFKATFAVKPEVTIGEYKGLAVEKELVVVEADEVDGELNRMAERNARTITVEDRAAALNDIANIDFEGFVDGVAFAGGKGEGFDLTLGSGQFIPGFEEQIVGKNIGEEFDVNVSFPEEYHSEELKGKASVFKVKLNALSAKETPAIDDEFAKDVSEFDTLAELKTSISDKIKEAKEKQAADAYESKLMETVVSGMTVELPRAMVETRIDEMAADFDGRLSMQGLNLQTYLQYTQNTMETFRKSFEVQAENQVKTRLALEKIAEVEGFEVSEEDVNAEFEKVAAHYNVSVERVRQAISPVTIKNDILCNKAVDLVRDTAVNGAAEKPKKKPAAKKTTKKEDGETEAKPKAKKATKKADEILD